MNYRSHECHLAIAYLFYHINFILSSIFHHFLKVFLNTFFQFFYGFFGSLSQECSPILPLYLHFVKHFLGVFKIIFYLIFTFTISSIHLVVQIQNVVFYNLYCNENLFIPITKVKAECNFFTPPNFYK